MKLPASFGNKLLFRIVFPGSVLTLAFVRYSVTIADVLAVNIALIYWVPIQIIIFGWFFLIYDKVIYILFEGRRYWPSSLAALGIKRERARLLSLHSKMRRFDTTRRCNQLGREECVEADRIYHEAAVELSEFPIGISTGMPRVIWPTRLGNLIATYEQYPEIKYGLDSVFFWPRLWVSLDKDLREEIDNQQAIADGALYVTLALVIAGFSLISYALVDAVTPGALSWKLDPKWELVSALICLMLAYLLYRGSLHSHAQFGDIFRSIFDQKRSLISIEEVVSLVATLTSNTALSSESNKKRNQAAWRYLRWHRVRMPGENANRLVRLR